MAVQSSERGPNHPAIPVTALDAIDLASSSGALALLNAATLLARQGRQGIGPVELFVAALAIGMPDSESSTLSSFASVSSSITSAAPSKSDSSTAHRWLYDWFVGRADAATVDRFIRGQVKDAFRLPPLGNSGVLEGEARLAAPEIELSREARALLGRACLLGGRTSRDNRYGVRHIVASLILPDRNGANESLQVLINQGFKFQLASAADMILTNATRNAPSSEAAAWRAIFKDPPATAIDGSDPAADGRSQSSEATSEAPDQADFAAAASPPSRPNDTPPPNPEFPVITLSGFTSDSLAAGNADPLGINPDVRAFARLICLEEATPPLSICLFGEWGSGKSTFMERMQREIARLTKPKPVRDAALVSSATASEPKFVENIVQIKFNAWHFADASLWASLTAVFFDQLRRGGSDGGRASDYQALIRKVANRVRSLEADATSAMEKVEDAKRTSDAADKALDTAQKQLAANDLTLAWNQLQPDFETIRTNSKDQLKEVGRRVYRDDLSSDTRAFAAAVAEAASTSGRIALIGRVLVGGGLPTVLGVVAVMLIACIGVALPAIDPTDAATWFQRIAAWGAGVFAALSALWQAFKTAKPILDGAWKYAKAVEEARAKLTQEVENKRRDAKAAAITLKAAETTLASARAPLSVYRDGMPADSPSTILRYFLFEDGDVQDYDKQVGIVSRARRSFEQLNSIVTTTRLNRKLAEAKRAANKELTQEEQGLLTPTDGKGLLVPDRIVLYIDDLDRCTHDQVYAVLQAIHLLLAFELFVVVVGVDVQWIAGAVARHFEADTSQGDDPTQPDAERRKRAIDYLEKIFQIPFWLQRLNTGSPAGPAGGSYGAYIRELLKDNVGATPGPNVFKSIVAWELREADGPLRDDASAEPDVADPASFAEATVAGEEAEFGAVDAALASLKLEQGEIDFLASPAVGAIASKSPRAVKRLINIYRIVRARLSDRELDEFLGRSGAPRYPIVALLAAIETGQPIELAEALYPALALLPPDARLNFIWSTIERPGPDRTAEAMKALLPIKNAFPALGTALAAVDRQCGEKSASVGAYIQMAGLVRRYSFNRYS